MNAAETAFETWKKTTPQDRSLLLLKIADALEAKGEELGRLESQNAGKPVGAAIDEMAVCADPFRFFAGANRVGGRPRRQRVRGQVHLDHPARPDRGRASIAPWNYPLYMATWKLGPALATGNTVVLKPSARTPLTALAFAGILAEILPPGVVNAVRFRLDIGDALVAHPKVRMVAITGDTATGKHGEDRLRHACRLHLELGGKAPVIVFDDADIDLAAETLRFAGYWNSGQDCTAATRPRRAGGLRQFVTALADQVRTIKWGDPAEGDDIEMDRSSRPPRPTRSRAWSTGRAAVRRSSSVASGRTARAPTTRRRSSPVPTRSRDHPGRDLRPGRDRPAVLRRGDRAGGRTTRRTASPRRSSPATSVGRCAWPVPRVRSRLDQRALHLDLRDPAWRRQADGLGQGREQVRSSRTTRSSSTS